ncbi:uncharacterized protein LOC121374818 [Gigantopelta aegis]|uniref:uncharacterized protein LOC121374818 n=1 Tax=Gigantopelta aegis TaxID=1735272 RepID=UPI001B88899F|nr:uncharacterized protein LOC121374818 [Gigantopelta aegis]
MMSIEDATRRRVQIDRRRSHLVNKKPETYFNRNTNSRNNHVTKGCFSGTRGCLSGNSSDDSFTNTTSCMRPRCIRKKKGYHVRAAIYEDKVGGQPAFINVSNKLFQVPKKDEEDIVQRDNLTPPNYELSRDYYRGVRKTIHLVLTASNKLGTLMFVTVTRGKEKLMVTGRTGRGSKPAPDAKVSSVADYHQHQQQTTTIKKKKGDVAWSA